MATLPTRIRQNIRDHFTSPTCPLTLKTASLTTTLGYPLTIDPEWTMLWKTLQSFYPDNATFVPSIANIVISWCEAFLGWIEREENEEQVEKLLDGLKGKGKVEIVLEISATSTRPITAWRANKSVFVIALPKSKPQESHTILSGFATDFLGLFTASPSLLPEEPPQGTAAAEDPEDWAALDLDSPKVVPLNQKQQSLSAKVEERDEMLPVVSTLQRPEELLKRPPYWMVPPVAEIKLQESAFGLGLLHDTLTMEAIRGREVSSMLVLVFVESVLGYTQVNTLGSAGSVWEFKRTRGFQ
ncbi:hypothetical protein G7Y89_g3042 [Cudoniella acicularis]|uniref:Uncharacterized protein n=1 Tax=Cudoniella acicularis TaxID=354080 RepID=A0A8H4RTY9_9HELO|nr:hypothetical protein G7Y89_g3042 [Cudoniella acicularis]